MRFELFIARRYLLARRKQTFISVISLISTIGVGVGVIALIVALALMTGIQGELRDRILGSTAHIYVWKDGGIQDYHAEVKRLLTVPHVLGGGPAIMGKALISSQDRATFITFKGIDPALEPTVTDIKKAMQEGSIDAIEPTSPDEFPGILLGNQLAEALQVAVGDTVSLLSGQGTLSPAGIVPRSRTARVAGIFSLGLQEFDIEWGFVSLSFAERLAGLDQVEMIQLRVDDIDAAPQIADAVERLGGYRAQDWTELNASLFSALGLEKLGMSIAIGLIMMVAALQIVASLVLLVMEKSRDIGILKTMGTSARRISAIFMMQGTIIGLVGTTVGAVIAVILCWVLTEYKLVPVPQDVYQVAYVPFIVTLGDFLTVVVSAIAVSFLATIYPSRQAARLDPVQALRFE